MSQLKFKIENGVLYVSENNGCSWEAIGEVVSPGQQGPQGEEGPQGEPGNDGQDGQDGEDGFSPYINQDGYWVLKNGTTPYKAAGTTYEVQAAGGEHIGEVGTPAVSQTTDPALYTTTLTFDYLKGETGDTPVLTANPREDNTGYDLFVLYTNETLADVDLENPEEDPHFLCSVFNGVDGKDNDSVSILEIVYANTSSDDSSEGMFIRDITNRFLGIELSNGLVGSEPISNIGLTSEDAQRILEGSVTSVIMNVPGERSFKNDDTLLERIPCNVIIDTDEYSTCLIIGQGYKAQKARVINSETATVTQEVNNISDYGVGLSPVLYCIHIDYDNVREEYIFHGFAIYPYGNFGLFGNASTIEE